MLKVVVTIHLLNARASACLIFIASLFMYVVILVKLAIIRAFVETHGILWEFTIKINYNIKIYIAKNKFLDENLRKDNFIIRDLKAILLYIVEKLLYKVFVSVLLIVKQHV